MSFFLKESFFSTNQKYLSYTLALHSFLLYWNFFIVMDWDLGCLIENETDCLCFFVSCIKEKSNKAYTFVISRRKNPESLYRDKRVCACNLCDWKVDHDMMKDCNVENLLLATACSINNCSSTL